MKTTMKTTKWYGAAFVNLTPHDITMDDGTVIPTSGNVARVKTVLIGCSPVKTVNFSSPLGLPDENFCTICGDSSPTVSTVSENGQHFCPDCGYDVAERPWYIVSAMFADAVPERTDVCSPATSEAKRDEKGQIVSVPFFCQKGSMLKAFKALFA